MERTDVQKLAKALRVMVRVCFIANIIALFLVPYVVYTVKYIAPTDGVWIDLRDGIMDFIMLFINAEKAQGRYLFLRILLSWVGVWGLLDCGLLTIFFLACGVCTALILRQAKKVLDTILAGEPFQLANAEALGRAAKYCWIISAAAFIRMILWLWMEKNFAPLFTYNTLFIFVFLMGGLLFQVMSALFRQAAELKEDQDLTI